MSPRNATMIGVSAAMLLGAGALLASWFWPQPAAAQQDVSCWLCTEGSCGKEFTKPVMELARLRQGNPDASPACPHCGKATTIRAVPCPRCHKFLKPLSHGRLPKVCTNCQQSIGESDAVDVLQGGAPAPQAAAPASAPAGK
jgi:hypothetical protein